VNRIDWQEKRRKKIHVSIFLLIFLLALTFRLFKLGDIPIGVTNDEASYIYSGYSIWRTGRDISGIFLPLSFNLENSLSPVPVYLLSPLVGLFGLSPFTGRLLFSLAGIGSVLLIYFITKQLFRNPSIALATMFVLAVSPWHLHFSRAAYEGGLSLFFILFGTYLFMRGIKKKVEILWSLPMFILGFYSYHATKIFLLFYILFLLFFYREKLLNNKKIFLLYVTGIILTLFSFLIVMKTQKVTRQDILIWNYMGEAKRTVDLERKINSAPFIIRQIFNNKPLYFLRKLRENYLEAFSPHFLFLYGETSGLGGIYGPFSRGELYILELPLLAIGLYYLFTKGSKSNRLFIIVVILMAPIQSAITFDKSYAIRSIIMLPFLSIVIGCGIYYSFSYLFLRYRKIFITIFSLFYIFLVAGYLYQYYFRYAIYGAESWFKSSRDVVWLMGQEKKNFNHIYVAEPGSLLVQYALWNKVDPQVIQKSYASQSPKKVENVVFLGGCIDTHDQLFDPNLYLPEKTMYIVPAGCYRHKMEPFARITQFDEPLRTIWEVYVRR